MNVGGRERVVLDILREIDRVRFQVDVVCLGPRGTLYDLFKETGVSLSFLNKSPGFQPKIFLKMKNHIYESSYDVVHCHNPGGFLYGAIGAMLARTPLIINSEHGYETQISRSKAFIETLMRNRIHMTLAVSDNLREQLSNRSLANKSNIRTLYNGIDCNLFKSRSKEKTAIEDLGISEHELVVGCVGRLSDVKDHATLIRSYKLIHKALPRTRLVIVGDGENRRSLERLADALELKGLIVFTGQRNDIPALLCRMDVFVLSSLNEGLSITLLEAMASGLPVVATSVGGNLEVIQNGLTGLLVPPQKPHRMTEAILRVLQDQNLARALGRAARQRVVQDFNIKGMIRKLERTYQSCSAGMLEKHIA